MKFATAICLVLLAASAGAVAREHTGELVVAVDTGTEMPMAKVVGGQLVAGLHKELGLALAQAMQRSPRFLVLPRKRLAYALERGDADLLCFYVPEWFPGAFDWSTPFLPFAEVSVTKRSAAQPASLADLAGQHIGTVLGYRHPEIEEVLGRAFVREDGPSVDINMRKLAAGRLNHAVTSSYYAAYRERLHDLPVALHPPLVVKQMRLQCAVSRHGRISVAQLDRAIAQLAHEGSIARILGPVQQ